MKFKDLFRIIKESLLVMLALVTGYSIMGLREITLGSLSMYLPGILEINPITLQCGETSGFWGQRVLELTRSNLEIDKEYDSILHHWKSVNSNVSALIIIPDFNIVEPVVCNVANNYQWLRTNVYGEYDVNGTVFLDYRCKLNFSPVKLLHGHNIGDGSVFSNLPEYLHYDNVADIGNVELYLTEGKIVYQPYAVLSVNSEEEAFPIDDLLRYDDLEKLTRELLDRSIVPGGKITSLDTLVLNTCWYGESGEEHNLHCLVVYSKVGA